MREEEVEWAVGPRGNRYKTGWGYHRGVLYGTELEREEAVSKFEKLEAETERNRLTNKLLQEKLNQEEQERRTKQMVLDIMQGLGTAQERSERLYQPVSPPLSQALKQGQTITNISGRPPEEGVSGGRFFTPTPPFPSQGLSSGLMGALARSVLGLKGETPEETLGRETTLQEMRTKGQMGMQEKIGARQLEAEKWKEGLADKRSQLSVGTQLMIGRSNSLDQQELLSRKNLDTVENKYLNSMAYMTGLGEGKEKSEARKQIVTWENLLRRADAEHQSTVKRIGVERKQIKLQLDPIMQQLGIPSVPEVPTPTADPTAVFDEYMRQKLDPHSYNYFNISGADARMILQRAKAKGVSPESYLEALMEVRKRDAKKSR